MRLKRLDMTGFKSFMERTVIEFNAPITAIVGPNGCGKSNVVDAIRWVMGEQSPKQLRGDQMEDVIFNGSEKKPALSMASVELCLNGEAGGFPPPYQDFTEVAICRRLYRDGTSDYLINRHPMRLRDILDFFAGTGLGKTHYSVVEQGRVNELIIAKPDERRAFIEEAAGVSRFKARKEAALRKMETCQGNLLRLGDILQELDRQMRSLERQVAKARRYEALEGELRDKDLTLSASRYNRMSAHLAELEARYAAVKEDVDRLHTTLDQREADMHAVGLKQIEEETRLADLQEKDYHYQNSLSLFASSQQFKTTERNDRLAASEQLKEEIGLLDERTKESDARLRRWQENETDLVNRVSTMHSEYEQAAAHLDRHKEHETLAVLELERLKEGLFRLHAELEKLSEREQHFLERQEKVNDKLTVIRNRLAASENHLSQTEILVAEDREALEKSKQLRIELSQNREHLIESINFQKAEETDQQVKLEQVEKEINKKRSRLDGLIAIEKSFEGYSEGVRFVMGKGQSREVLGTVAQILETDSRYETALAAALSDKLQHVVCSDQLSGKAILENLKQSANGRVALIPLALGYCPANTLPIQDPGVIGPLRKFVRVKTEKYVIIADMLLDNVIVVEDLSIAIALFNRIHATRPAHCPAFVTLDGDLLAASGILIGGSGDNGSQELLRNHREQKELKTELAEHEQSYTLQDDIRNKLILRIQRMDRELEALKESQHEEELHCVEIENRLQSTQDKQDQGKAIFAELEQERKTLEEEKRELDALFNELGERRNALHSEMTATELVMTEQESKLQTIKADLHAAQEQTTEIKMRMAGIDDENLRFKAEGTRLQQEFSELRDSFERRNRDFSFHIDRLSQLDQELTGIAEQMQREKTLHGEIHMQLEQAKASYQGNQETLRAEELSLHELRKERDEASKELHELSLQTKEESIQCEHALEHCRMTYTINLQHWIAEHRISSLTPDDEEGLSAETSELREKLERLGPVNMDAIAEFDEIKNRFDFLSKQKEDLENSLAGLEKAVVKIDHTSRERMLEAFNFINNAFQIQFPKLFRGGRAYLALTNEEDILASGVDVFAQPPGKKLQTISLLSGGEKALTALSLLFSILNYRPSPFCILDEVDAPLDDQNVHRYNELIRTMTDRTQFILITHAKLTMEIAHTLYGVTMPEAGVSKIVTVDLEETQPAEAAA